MIPPSRFGPGGAEFDDETLATWVRANWSEDLTLRQWWQRLADAGLAFPSWPTRWGGADAGRDDLRRRNRALVDAGALGPPTGLGVMMGAPVVLQYGTDDQKARFLPPLANGTEGWCQLFSEPDAGSDLASVTTAAIRDGDEWIVNGQKIWTSGAGRSDRGMLIARTDPDQPKHRGIGYFVITMDQPGIEIRPIHQMNGESHFSEVFFDEARVADRDRIEPHDRGWGVALATLGFERAGLGDAMTPGGLRPPAGERAGYLDRTVTEVRSRIEQGASAPVEDVASASSLTDLAHRRDAREPVSRDGLARLHSSERLSGWLQSRTAQTAAAGLDPGRTALLLKLDWTERLRVARDLSLRIGGPAVIAWDPSRDRRQEEIDTQRALLNFALSVPSASIAGGSDEVQRNVIAERVLGLPKDVAVDRGVAFKDRTRGKTR